MLVQSLTESFIELIWLRIKESIDKLSPVHFDSPIQTNMDIAELTLKFTDDVFQWMPFTALPQSDIF